MLHSIVVAVATFAKPRLAILLHSAGVFAPGSKPKPSIELPLDVATGSTYRARNGAKVGPLRPFRDEKDGPHTDAAGRSAWFMAEGVGAFDRYGRHLTGHRGDSLSDLIAEWTGEPIEIDQFSSLKPLQTDIRNVYSH
ncbi:MULTISPECIES: hypothetical protein [unclassified Mesorhizobium]|uniref:hypothetical protein n=1 Tax=unclassified Mesorhizobium TaxID=325217 RepID=UPI0033380A21